MPSNTATLTTTGATAATGILDLTLAQGDTMAQFGISGTYGTVTFKFYASSDGTNFDECAAIRVATGLVVTSTISPSDNTAYVWNVPCAGMAKVRLYITAIASGSVAATVKSFAQVGMAGLGTAPMPTNSGTFSGATFNGTASTFSVMPVFPAATVAATGNAIGNAAAVTTGFTAVTGANNNAAVLLPAAAAGLCCIIKTTTSGSVLKVFPSVNNAINGAANNAVYNMANLSQRTFYALNAAVWYTAEETPT